MVQPNSQFDSIGEFTEYQRSKAVTEKMRENFLCTVQAGIGSLVDIEGYPNRIAFPGAGSQGTALLANGSVFEERKDPMVLMGRELLAVEDMGNYRSVVVGERIGLGATAETIDGKRGNSLYFPLHRIIAFSFAQPAQD